jgi:hypothetical protein
MRQTPLSTGADVVLANHLVPEQPTVIVFYKPSSMLEQQFFEGLQAQVSARKEKFVGLKAVHLKTGDEPIAKKNEITTTPMAIVFDRRGRQTGKATTPDAITKFMQQAADLARIDWVTEASDARFQEIKKMGAPFQVPQQIPGILRTMSAKPEAMILVQEIASLMQFSDGFLPRKQKEMIATYVSGLNRCKY